MVVHFRNLTNGYHSIHVHGLRYDKPNEGAVYANNLPGIAVGPNGNFTYHWFADAGSGPPAGESSRLWLYHGHVNEPEETNSGLIGPVINLARCRQSGWLPLATAANSVCLWSSIKTEGV